MTFLIDGHPNIYFHGIRYKGPTVSSSLLMHVCLVFIFIKMLIFPPIQSFCKHTIISLLLFHFFLLYVLQNHTVMQLKTIGFIQTQVEQICVEVIHKVINKFSRKLIKKVSFQMFGKYEGVKWEERKMCKQHRKQTKIIFFFKNRCNIRDMGKIILLVCHYICTYDRV